MAHNNTQHSHQERWECHEGQAHDQRPLPAVPVPDAANDESSHRTHYERSAVHREARDQARRRPPPAVVLTFGRGGEEHRRDDVAEKAEEGEVVPDRRRGVGGVSSSSSSSPTMRETGNRYIVSGMRHETDDVRGYGGTNDTYYVVGGIYVGAVAARGKREVGGEEGKEEHALAIRERSP